jgi:Protein of unknown function (DUF3011)
MRPHLPHQQVPGKFLASSWRTVLLKSAPRARFQVDRKPPAWLTGRPGQIFTCLWERVLRFLRPTTNRRVEGGAMNHRPYRAPFHALSAILLFLICVPVLRAQNVITCSSNNGKRNFCSLGGFNNARLVNQRSGSPCVQGQTWGISGNSVWVDRGCRADFQPMRGPGGGPGYGPGYGPGNGSGNRQGQQVRCSSNNMNYVRCPTNGSIARAQLARQISGSACIQGQTWGYDKNSLWVNKGCRADFTVWYR